MLGPIPTLVRRYGPCTNVGIGPDTRVDIRPRTSLSVGLVYISYLSYYKPLKGLRFLSRKLSLEISVKGLPL